MNSTPADLEGGADTRTAIFALLLERQREGIAKAKAENRYMGRRPSARLKADEAAKLFKAGRSVTDTATALNIGRGSVYRALEARPE